jgi:hypothetical protein
MREAEFLGRGYQLVHDDRQAQERAVAMNARLALPVSQRDVHGDMRSRKSEFEQAIVDADVDPVFVYGHDDPDWDCRHDEETAARAAQQGAGRAQERTVNKPTSVGVPSPPEHSRSGERGASASVAAKAMAGLVGPSPSAAVRKDMFDEQAGSAAPGRCNRPRNGDRDSNGRANGNSSRRSAPAAPTGSTSTNGTNGRKMTMKKGR